MPKLFIYCAILSALGLVGCERDNNSAKLATQKSTANQASEKQASSETSPPFRCDFVFEPLPGFDRPVARVVCDPAFPPVSEIIFFTADTQLATYNGYEDSYFPTSTEVFDDFRVEWDYTSTSISRRYLKLAELNPSYISHPLSVPLSKPKSLIPPDPAQVPTPGLLSGLIGISVAALHRRVQSADDQ
jgi:hypothetical protein